MSIDTTDQDLLARVRSGDTAAFGDLYAHHSAAAHRAARRIVRDPHVAEDLVSESFARVFSALRSENGPRGDLFPYLLVTMRNVAATWGRDTGRWTPVGDDTAFQPKDARDAHEGADEAPVDKLAVSLTSSAFVSLPRRWRTVLWYLEVEGESATEVGQRLGLSDVAVRQLAKRAREGLREAYLTAYLGGGTPTGAHIPSNDLVQMARGKISIRRRAAVEGHLDTCPRCTRMLFEAAEENSTLRALAIPFYVAAGLVVAKGFMWLGHLVKFVFPRGAKLGPGASAAGAAVAVTAVAVAAAAVGGLDLTGSHGHKTVAGGPGGQVTSPSQTSSSASGSATPTPTPTTSTTGPTSTRTTGPRTTPGKTPPAVPGNRPLPGTTPTNTNAEQPTPSVEPSSSDSTSSSTTTSPAPGTSTTTDPPPVLTAAQRYAAAISADSPTIYPLGGTSAAVTADSGHVAGGVSVTTAGPFAGSSALEFDGQNGSSVASSTLVQGPMVYTEEFWFKAGSSTSSGKLVGFGDAQSGNSANYDRHVYMTATGRLIFGVWIGGTKQYDAILSPQHIDYRTGLAWHHIVATQDGTSMSLYVDGTLVKERAEPAQQAYAGYWRVGGDNLALWPTQYPNFTWGNWDGGTSSSYFDGSIAQVAIYQGKALTAGQVAAHYAVATS